MTGNIIENINARIIKWLREGKVPWKRRWDRSSNFGYPTNVATGQPYRGVNALLLNMAPFPWTRPKWWGNCHQWEQLGGKPRKGLIYGTRIIHLEAASVAKTALRRELIYCADEVDGVEKYQLHRDEERPPAFHLADKVIRATGADIWHRRPQQAYYDPNLDQVVIPCKCHFRHRLPNYYDVVFHELAHWTQAQRRLSWRGTLEEGELRAEIASAFLCQIFGIPNAETPTPNHQKYVDAWVTGLEADPWLIVRIAEQASEAVDYILSFSDPSAG